MYHGLVGRGGVRCGAIGGRGARARVSTAAWWELVARWDGRRARAGGLVVTAGWEAVRWMQPAMIKVDDLGGRVGAEAGQRRRGGAAAARVGGVGSRDGFMPAVEEEDLLQLHHLHCRGRGADATFARSYPTRGGARWFSGAPPSRARAQRRSRSGAVEPTTYLQDSRASSQTNARKIYI